MAQDAPDPTEVNTFKFVQLRMLRISSIESRSAASLNLIAASSRYGLVFVGVEGGFKVLKLENMLDLDEDKDKYRQPADAYSCQTVATETPLLLSLSSDEMTLAVCMVKGSQVVADMYDVRAFGDVDDTPLPFITVQLSSHPTELKDFMWNPSVIEMYAFCLGDGSAHVHEIVETNLNILSSLPPQTGATSVCWSPKGKQVVIGKKDGSFSQYKPTLQEMKKIPPPRLENSVEVLNMCWLSTALFAAVYVPATTNDKTPCLMLVYTPKGAEPRYTNFGDLCLGNDRNQKPRYTMHYQAEWGLLICASANSVETAIIGCSNNEKGMWMPWVLDGGGRADLPIDKYKESFPLGMAVMFCAQRKIFISETESYPPMPVLLLLSTTGFLCPFHMLNVAPGAANIVYPSEAISRDGERKPKVGSVVASVAPKSSAAMPFSVTPSQRPVPSNSIIGNLPMSPIPMPNSQPPAPRQQVASISSLPMFGKPESAPPSFFSSIPSSTPLQQRFPAQPLFTPVAPPNAPSAVPMFQSFSSTPRPQSAFPASSRPLQPSMLGLRPSIPSASPPSLPPMLTPTMVDPVPVNLFLKPLDMPMIKPVAEVHCSEPPVPVPSRMVKSEEVEDNAVKEKIYMSQISEQISSFDKDLQKLKNLCMAPMLPVGTSEEMAYIKKNTLELSDFDKDMKETMESLNADIQHLKIASLESFAMVGDAQLCQQKQHDHNYLRMLRDRPLDPVAAKRLQKIEHLFQYLSTQLQTLHSKLDQDWIELTERKRDVRRNSLRIPSIQAIYQTVVNNQNTIHTLQSHLQYISEGYRKMKKGSSITLHTFKPSERNSDNDLEKLADVLLDGKKSNVNVESDLKKPHGRKELSPAMQTAIREALSNRRISCVRPTHMSDPSQSRLLSSVALFLKGKQSEETKSTIVSRASEASSKESFSVHITSPSVVKAPSAFTAKSPQMPNVRSTIALKPQRNTVLQVQNASEEVKAISPTTPPFTPKTSQSAFTQLSPQSKEVKNLRDANINSAPQKQPMIFPTQGPPTTNVVFTKPEVPVKLMPFSSFTFNVKGSGLGETQKTSAINFPSVSATSLAVQKTPINSSSVSSGQSSLYEDITPPPSPNDFSEPDVFFPDGVGSSGGQISNIGSPLVVSVKPPSRQLSMSSASSPVLSASPNTASFSSILASHLRGGLQQVPDISDSVPSGEVFVVSTSKDGEAVARQITPTAQPLKEITGATSPADELPSVLGLTPANKSPFTGSRLFRPTNQTFNLSTNNSPSNDSTNEVLTTVKAAVSLAESNSTAKVAVNNSPFSALVANQHQDVSPALGTDNEKGKTVPEMPLNLSHESTEQAVQSSQSSSDLASESKADSAEVIKSMSSALVSPFSNSASPVSAANAEPKSKSVFGQFLTSISTSGTAETPVFGAEKSTPSYVATQPQVTSTTTESSVSTASSSLFGQKVTSTTTSSGFFGSSPAFSSFGQKLATTSSFFSQPTSAQSSVFGTSSVFGQTAASSNTATVVASDQSSGFGQVATTSQVAATAPSSPFGQVVTTAPSSPFGQVVTTAPSSPFGQVATTAPSSPFGQVATTAPSSPFGQVTTTSSAPSSIFGQPTTASSLFGKVATTSSSSPFGSSSATSVFGQSAPALATNVTTSTKSPFNQTTTVSSPFGQASSGFFMQSSGGTSAFGQKEQPQAGNTSVFGGQSSASGFSFGKSSFGQGQTGSFGLAKAVFGQTQTASASPFGQSTEQSVFGQSSFFGGLGGTPSQENASKNVFGSVKSPQGENANSLFGNQGASSFGAKTSGFTGGSFTSVGGSVAQSGFGAFQQSPQKSGFGSPPSFGGGPTFGGSPAFGGSPSFGAAQTGNALGSSPFGTAQSSSFSAFAGSDAPTFGSLASQSGGFSSMQQQQQQQPVQNMFGGALFGGDSSAPSFGGQQQSGFGSPGTGNSSSAFTQWRN